MSQFIDIFLLYTRCPTFYQHLKRLQLCQCPLGEIEVKHHWLLDDLPQTNPMYVGCLCYFCDSCISDTPGRIVDDSSQCLLIIRIRHHTEIGDDILYFLALIETQPPVYPIWNSILPHLFLKRTALCIRPIKDSKVRELSPLLPADTLDVVTHNHRLLLIAIGGLQHQPFTLLILTEHILMNLPFILSYQAVCSLHNQLCRAIVLFQLIQFCILVLLLEIQDIVNISSSETIDALGIIAHHTYATMFMC